MKKLLLTVCTILSGIGAQAQTDWAGTYTVVAKEPFFYTETAESYGVTLAETFELTIAKQDDKYVITSMMGHDLTQSHDGVIEIEPDASKETVCYIPTKRHLLTSEYYERTETLDEGLETQRDTLITGYKGIALCGNNMGNDPIKVTRQSDGQIKMSTFVLGYKTDQGGTVPLGWFDKNVPLNGGDPEAEVVPYAWTGTYLVETQGVFQLAEGVDCPTAFLMTIEEDMWNPGTYLVTEFWGRESVGMINIFTGGLPLVLDTEDGDKSYLTVAPGQNLLAERDETSYFALTDGFGLGTENVSFTHNADDSFTIDMFSINTYSYYPDHMPETIAMYFGATAKKGDREALLAELAELEAAGVSAPGTAAEEVSREYYNANGVRIAAPQKGINVVSIRLSNGQTVTRKLFVR